VTGKLKKSDYISLCAGFLALVVGLYAIFGLAPDREVKSLGIFLFKILPFALASVCIAFLNADFLKKFKLHFPILLIGFLGYFAFFIPKIFFALDDFVTVYYLTLLEVPYIILLISLAVRLGGGSTETCLRLSFAMLFLMLSGIEDLAFLTVNHHTDPQWATIPDVWTWASHIKVIIGHYPTKYEAYVFIAVNVLLAVLIAFVPINKLKEKSAKNYEEI